jgi:hypothetical protein
VACCDIVSCPTDMDLLKVLKARVDALDVPECTPGLRAVLQHVQVAAGHLTRGSANGDDTAFTDAIYRTNQAFEGSLKEAFRTLAGRDPASVRPFDIENYFQSNAVLRQRVLDQLSTYRTDWRNPSTHDYKLDFDENEALLAIVSVCAFAIVLIDQIAAKASYEKARAVSPISSAVAPSPSLPDAVADALLTFKPAQVLSVYGSALRKSEVIGALAGHLTTLLPAAQISSEALLVPGARERADIMITASGAKLLIEVQRGRHVGNIRSLALAELSHCIALSGIRDAVLYFFDDEGERAMKREDYPLPGVEARVILVSPVRQARQNGTDVPRDN